MTWLDDLDEKVKAATAGPWQRGHWGEPLLIGGVGGPRAMTGTPGDKGAVTPEAIADAEAIVALRNNADRLIALARCAEQAEAVMRAKFKENQHLRFERYAREHAKVLGLQIGLEAAERRAQKYREALGMVRKCIHNSRQAPNVLDTIDFVAKRALADTEE